MGINKGGTITRLWHWKLIPYLPKSQLLAQWRELNSIFKKQDKHILVNYVYEYPKDSLLWYSILVVKEMKLRGYKINSLTNLSHYFGILLASENNFEDNENPFPNHHNNRYLLQCFYNLQEKYDSGQKDFNKETYDKMEKMVKEQTK